MNHIIYLAGGCFWGTEQLMQSIPGVIDAQSGYANGKDPALAEYKRICQGGTGFRETVKVSYDPEQVCLENLLLAYFYVVDPAARNRQGNDIGEQYQAGIYWTDEESREIVERIAEVEKSGCPGFAVEMGPLQNFYAAEEYHQNYLEKNPGGYCHIPWTSIRLFSQLKIRPEQYEIPARQLVNSLLGA